MTNTITAPNGRFAFAGDWHGNWRWAVAAIHAAGSAGVSTIFHAGDFGIWHGPSGDEFLGKVRAALKKNNITLYVTLGNHENYDLVEEHEKDENGIAWFRNNIAILPRVFGFEYAGYNFLSLGGAPSIDFEYRTMYRDWWPQELMTDEEVDRAIAVAQSMGGIDFMVSHDAPEPATYRVNQIVATNPMGWSNKALNYAASGRNRITRAVYEIKPNIFIHGHYHVFDFGTLKYGDSEGGIISLHPDSHQHNMVLFDTEDIYSPYVSYGTHTLDFKPMLREE